MMSKLEQCTKRRTDETIQELSQYLSIEELKTCVTSWTMDEVQEVHGSWEVTEFQIMKLISSLANGKRIIRSSQTLANPF